jgi:hypothetical protein
MAIGGSGFFNGRFERRGETQLLSETNVRMELGSRIFLIHYTLTGEGEPDARRANTLACGVRR